MGGAYLSVGRAYDHTVTLPLPNGITIKHDLWCTANYDRIGSGRLCARIVRAYELRPAHLTQKGKTTVFPGTCCRPVWGIRLRPREHSLE